MFHNDVHEQILMEPYKIKSSVTDELVDVLLTPLLTSGASTVRDCLLTPLLTSGASTVRDCLLTPLLNVRETRKRQLSE
jgi:hypothetical protein